MTVETTPKARMREPTTIELSDIAMAIASSYGFDQDRANAVVEDAVFVGVLDGYVSKDGYFGRLGLFISEEWIESFVWPDGVCQTAVPLTAEERDLVGDIL